MMQQSTHAFAEYRDARSIIPLCRSRRRAPQIPYVFLKRIAAAHDLIEQTTRVQDLLQVGVRRGTWDSPPRSLGRGNWRNAANSSSTLIQVIGVKILHLAHTDSSHRDFKPREYVVEIIAIDGERLSGAAAEIAQDQVARVGLGIGVRVRAAARFHFELHHYLPFANNIGFAHDGRPLVRSCGDYIRAAKCVRSSVTWINKFPAPST